LTKRPVAGSVSDCSSHVAHAGERADPEIPVRKRVDPSHLGKMIDVQRTLRKNRAVLDQSEKICAAGDEGELRILDMRGDRSDEIIGPGESKHMHDSAPPHGVRHGLDDVGIAGAAAEISTHPLPNLRLREIRNPEWPGKVWRGGARPARLLDHGDALFQTSKSACSPRVLEGGFLTLPIVRSFHATERPFRASLIDM
jgi:hypothetical protein